MVILHVHECGIRIGLAVIIPPLKTGGVPVADCLTFQKTPEQLQVFLVTAFPLPSAMDKNSMLFFTGLFQKPADFLKILRPCVFSYPETLYVFLIQQRNCLLYLLENFCFPFPYGFLPDESIFVRVGLQFCSVNKNGFLRQLARIFHPLYHLIEEILTGIRQESGTETCDRTVVRCFLPGEQPHKVDISPACGFNFWDK